MKIAILINDPVIRSTLSEILSSMNWLVDFYENSMDFGRADISGYDIIITDISSKPLDGRQILQSIRNKTEAELYLMGNGSFLESDIFNEHIKGLINKSDINDFIDKINYASIKKRLQNSIALHL